MSDDNSPDIGLQQPRSEAEQKRIAEIEANSPFPRTSHLHGEFMFREIEKMDKPAPVKPREFSIIQNMCGLPMRIALPGLEAAEILFPNDYVIRVIELSGYAELQAECERLALVSSQALLREAELIEALRKIYSGHGGDFAYHAIAREALEANEKAKNK